MARPPLSVQLDGTASYDNDGTITAYVWTWVGGSATGKRPRVSFPTASYDVVLTVLDEVGGAAATTIRVFARTSNTGGDGDGSIDTDIDTDGDGVADSSDNCPTVANPSQQLPIFYADLDGDGLGDPDDAVSACDPPLDYVANALDKCPAVYSLNNVDTDGDGIGDACDEVIGAVVNYSFEPNADWPAVAGG